LLDKPPTLLARYEALAAAGALERDPAQLLAVATLDALARKLAAPKRTTGFRLPFLKRRKSAPRGVYLWGGVGRGKTTLMDLFFDAAPVAQKRRVHFYAFMAEAHERLHHARKDAGATLDPLIRVAQDLARETELLCFDEFAVYDIADATILARLFGALFDLGVVLVATSNVEPGRLYEGGRNRDLFLPFVTLLLERTTVVELDARADFRLEKTCVDAAFFVLASEGGRREAQARILAFMGGEGRQSLRLPVNGRTVEAEQIEGRKARFDFLQLCGRPLGATDYLELTRLFDALVVENVPALNYERRDEAKRFIALIDVLYETRTKLILTAEVEAERLYNAHHGPEAQEFRRTVSRLYEIRSREYIEEWRRTRLRESRDESRRALVDSL